MVREQNRLGVLEVSSAGHSGAHVFLRLTAERLDVAKDLLLKSIGRIGHKHTDQRRNLIIATAAGADLATDIATSYLDQATL